MVAFGIGERGGLRVEVWVWLGARAESNLRILVDVATGLKDSLKHTVIFKMARFIHALAFVPVIT